MKSIFGFRGEWIHPPSQIALALSHAQLTAFYLSFSLNVNYDENFEI